MTKLIDIFILQVDKINFFFYLLSLMYFLPKRKAN